MTTINPGRIFGEIIFLFGFLMFSPSMVLADAKTDGDKGIEEYRKGNLIEGMFLLESSAEEGYVPAQVTLAYILDQGEQNIEAFHWYQQSANLNHPAGLFGLAGMYAKGEGVPQSHETAVHWITLAAEHGHTKALKITLQKITQSASSMRLSTNLI